MLELWTILPFVGILLSIALLPLFAPHWWHFHRNQAAVAAIFGIPIGIYVGMRDLHFFLHTVTEFFSFIVLLAALFTISGGIYVTGNLLGTPRTNLTFLGLGALLANLIGTTGASMILIRPLIRANSERKRTAHIFVFFIFAVSNCGGLLTPLGDPPLFLGFLQGVPFAWTLGLLPQWIFCIGAILTVFAIRDSVEYAKEESVSRVEDAADYVPIGISGKINIVFLCGVIAACFLPFLWREGTMIAMLGASLKFGPSGPRKSNSFTFGPITEVAILFAGIFMAMMPALKILEVRGDELPLSEAWHYFWTTGFLSSFLDNAPAYLTVATGAASPNSLAVLAASSPRILAAVSCGAVFMGALTYIGNAPNFMVKSICEEAGVKMPSFFGYLLYSSVVLIPIFLGISLIFFS